MRYTERWDGCLCVHVCVRVCVISVYDVYMWCIGVHGVSVCVHVCDVCVVCICVCVCL